MSDPAALLMHLRRLSPLRGALAARLNADPACPCVYYLASLPNLHRIRDGGGLLPRNVIERLPLPVADLSGHDIQALRRIPAGGLGPAGAQVHDCVNLFLNPLNWTLYQFRRKALLHADQAARRDAAQVAVLEIDLAALLAVPGLEWRLSERNLAAAAHLSADPAVFTAPEFPWETIYSLGAGDYDLDHNYTRSAEFLIYLPDERPLPWACVRRILALDADLARLGADLEALGRPTAVIAADPNLYALQPLPLKDDLKLLDALSAYLPEPTGLLALLADLGRADLSALQAEFSAYPDHGPAVTLRRAFWRRFLQGRDATAGAHDLAASAATLAGARVDPHAPGGVEVVLAAPLAWEPVAQLWQERRFRWLVQRLEAVMRYTNLEARPPQTPVERWCAELLGSLTAAARWGVDLPAATAAWGRALTAAS